MKIDYNDIFKLRESLGGGKKSADKTKSETNDFQTFLNNSITGSSDESQSSENTSPTVRAAEIMNTIPLQIFSGTNESDDAFIANQMEFTVDLLDEYAGMLADPRKTLKDIEPVLTKLTDEAESLKINFSDKNIDDPELKSMLNDLLFSVMTEQIRFQRGDYIDR